MKLETPVAAPGEIVIVPGEAPLAVWRKILREAPQVGLVASAREQVAACHAVVTDLIATGRPIYAVNTGFGKLAVVSIDRADLAELQRNLILSHCASTGELLSDDLVRLIMVMKAGALAQGFSGVRWEIVEALLRLANAGVYPCIPAKGSVGASGDLAPLAHMAAVLIGLGEARVGGRVVPAAEGIAKAGLKPLNSCAERRCGSDQRHTGFGSACACRSVRRRGRVAGRLGHRCFGRRGRTRQ